MKDDEVRKASLDSDIYRGGRSGRLIIRLVVLGRLDKRGDIVHGVSSGQA